MKINVETIPHNCQRYDTVGDWTFEPDGTLNVNISNIFAPEVTEQGHDSEFLVAIHEIIEAYLCKKAGITAEQVDEWDFEFEKQQGAGQIPSNDLEPGNDPHAPYHVQHLIAQSIEMMLCAQLKLSWEQHCKNVESVK